MLQRRLPRPRDRSHFTVDSLHISFALGRIFAVGISYPSQSITFSHTQTPTVTFVFLGILRRNVGEFYTYLDSKDAFHFLDKDKDGRLSSKEVSQAIQHILPRHPTDSLQDAEYQHLLKTYTTRVLSKLGKSSDGSVSFNDYTALEDELSTIRAERSMAFRIIH